MLWRAPYGGARFDADKGEPNRRRFERLVKRGEARGCLAWIGEEAVGWVSVGPRDSFPYFERSRALAPLPGERVWCVTCFYVRAGCREQGIASALLGGAVALARREGASRIEGYPIVPKRKDEKVSGAFAWTGLPTLFDAAGFTRAKHPASGRLVCRLELGN
jgi:GNAT superfamily N-acetyltransferase